MPALFKESLVTIYCASMQAVSLTVRAKLEWVSTAQFERLFVCGDHNI